MKTKLSINSSTPIPNFPPLTHPILGFGVYLSPAEDCKNSCLAALRTGYRCIDTAQCYDNEVAVGDAVRESKIARKSLFITTKVLSPLGSVEKTLQRCRQSVKDIGLGYVDLFLIHSPAGGPEARKELWKALELLKSEGGTKTIGVSN
jgi:diketogulonate reductase-like aldo/keto reductase